MIIEYEKNYVTNAKRNHVGQNFTDKTWEENGEKKIVKEKNRKKKLFFSSNLRLSEM